MVLDLGPFRRYFTLAASVFFSFIQCNYDTSCSQTCPFLPGYPKCSRVNFQQPSAESWNC